MRSELLPIVIAVILAMPSIGAGIVLAQPASYQYQQSQAIQNSEDREGEEQGEKQEGSEGNEPANEQSQEQGLHNGGHQDPGGTSVEHQFEGIE